MSFRDEGWRWLDSPMNILKATELCTSKMVQIENGRVASFTTIEPSQRQLTDSLRIRGVGTAEYKRLGN